MDNIPAKHVNDYPIRTTSRRQLLWVLGAAAVGAPFASFSFGQGQCRDGYGTQSCPLNANEATAPIKPVFAPTGWKTVALDHITFQMPDCRKEAAFYIALMGWRLRSDDGKQAVLDIGHWGSAIFKRAPEQRQAVVENFCFVVEPWNAKTVQAERRSAALPRQPRTMAKGSRVFM